VLVGVVRTKKVSRILRVGGVNKQRPSHDVSSASGGANYPAERKKGRKVGAPRSKGESEALTISTPTLPKEKADKIKTNET